MAAPTQICGSRDFHLLSDDQQPILRLNCWWSPDFFCWNHPNFAVKKKLCFSWCQILSKKSCPLWIPPWRHHYETKHRLLEVILKLPKMGMGWLMVSTCFNLLSRPKKHEKNNTTLPIIWKKGDTTIQLLWSYTTWIHWIHLKYMVCTPNIWKNDLVVLNVGNGWVAGGCWDYEIDS